VLIYFPQFNLGQYVKKRRGLILSFVENMQNISRLKQLCVYGKKLIYKLRPGKRYLKMI